MCVDMCDVDLCVFMKVDRPVIGDAAGVRERNESRWECLRKSHECRERKTCLFIFWQARLEKKVLPQILNC